MPGSGIAWLTSQCRRDCGTVSTAAPSRSDDEDGAATPPFPSAPSASALLGDVADGCDDAGGGTDVRLGLIPSMYSIGCTPPTGSFISGQPYANAPTIRSRPWSSLR